MEILRFGINAADFSVDTERRTMTGPVVRFGSISSPKNGRRYRFAPGAIRWVDPKFVKFLEDHTQSFQLGRATQVEETDTELRMTFRVAEGRRGDRALAKAASGEKTGLSVGVEFEEADTEKAADGVWDVTLANLPEVSFVKDPSFNDSRVQMVTLSKEEGTAMETCATCGQQLTPGVAHTCPTPPDNTPQPITFTADQLAWMQANGLGIHQPQVVTPPEPRPVIKPKVTTKVTEPKNYTFSKDGDLEPAKHDFGMDIVRGMNPAYNDLGARQRVEEFLTEQFVVTTDVDELNPTVNLPKYIDEREYRTPVWNTINRGAPPNGVQPFAWPAFSSATGASGAHTEGTEPSLGTYVTTKQQVTPSPTSGKYKLSREIWDMGGTPGLGGLIWRKMLRSYNEGLEAKAVATLDAATPTSLGTFTVGGGTTGQTLSAELIQALAKLLFVRGGFTMDTGFAQIDLYLALVGARDGQGRPLFPALGPTNANGTVAQRFGAVNVNGTLWYPAWALAATGIVAASSYLFDSTSVDGWATPPRQLLMPEIEVANVYIGIWGYSAAAINDLNGVRELIYDPA